LVVVVEVAQEQLEVTAQQQLAVMVEMELQQL
jgi:hypothetical protein